ncbi:MAG: sigma-70 family RNA polymerase sigma factor [Thermovenabulum sp.]|uniref:sigma-70 family RNA polymerase sigma factor n=1 Tax=Thermovenabulum sp. TaxID=3100335 RepID=UPI003C7B3BBB
MHNAGNTQKNNSFNFKLKSESEEIYQLIERIQIQNDEEAFKKLIETYKKDIIITAKKFYLSGIETNDIIQELLIEMWNIIKCYDRHKSQNINQFIKACLHKKAISIFKKYTRKKHWAMNESISYNTKVKNDKNYDDDMEIIDIIKDTKYEPENIVIEKEKTKELINNIKKELTDYERKVLLYYINDLSYKQMAHELGKDEKSVDNALIRIKRKIKRICKLV